jgi:phosphatidylserine/phosphatidylglycerophosphate/cardiolipin synthase-like enzyme
LTLPYAIYGSDPDFQKHQLFNPPDSLGAPDHPDPNELPVSGAGHQSVQILRSRFHSKTTFEDWKFEPKGAIHDVYLVMKKAIAAASQYIYIEDQFLADSINPEEVIETTAPNPWSIFSLFPELVKALLVKDSLRLIFVGSGKSDPIDFSPGARNLDLTDSIKKLVELLPMAKKRNVAVWRVKDATVHSKLMLIDDEFACVGSANFHSRSMYGTDQELQAAIVAEDDFVKDLRCKLWAEHWWLEPYDSQEVRDALRDASRAVPLWRSEWAGDPNTWRKPDNPSGFIFPRTNSPTRWGGVEPVGPLPLD